VDLGVSVGSIPLTKQIIDVTISLLIEKAVLLLDSSKNKIK
jgi:hypothetical protein